MYDCSIASTSGTTTEVVNTTGIATTDAPTDNLALESIKKITSNIPLLAGVLGGVVVLIILIIIVVVVMKKNHNKKEKRFTSTIELAGFSSDYGAVDLKPDSNYVQVNSRPGSIHIDTLTRNATKDKYHIKYEELGFTQKIGEGYSFSRLILILVVPLE